ncbi:pecanex protein [Dictyocaulus viviparus]|uniref:Pecanex-like protein n=1 Tax=Dictyocaulus viviparus TaxID=29172 RepID=A0A0D8XQG5_DICVI|nr:pecanex protein [Dictyocaulus viviparus]
MQVVRWKERNDSYHTYRRNTAPRNLGVSYRRMAIVARLHVVFDTCEPVITTKALSVSGSREPEDEVGVEMVELREMRRRVSSDNELINHSPVMLEVLIKDNHRRVQNATEFNQLENDNEVMMQRAMNLEEDSDEDLKSKIIEVKDVAIVEKMQDNSDFNLSIVEPNNFICPSPKKGSHYSLMSRKLSEPLMAYGRRQDVLFETDSFSHGRVRRANSTFEASMHSTNNIILSQSSLDHARKTTRRSYPSKIGSADGLDVLGCKTKAVKKDVVFAPLRDTGFTVYHALDDRDKLPDLRKSTSFADCPDFEAHKRDGKHSCEILCEDLEHSSDTAAQKLEMSPAVSGEKILKQKDTEVKVVNDVVQHSEWCPMVISLGDTNHSESTSMNKISDEMSSGADIKLEITKFLEELIEKHPETLDVIENVRQSRLGRNTTPNRMPQMLRRRSSSYSVAALSEIALRDGTHVASGHEDTSQGAVHSFQDVDGVWWTYAFDEHGVGTAQPLGSGRALMELLQSTQSASVGKNRLDVLPESAYVSSEDEGEPCSSRSTTNLAALNAGNTRRERALSSSSNESYTYIPQLPTTVFHAPTGIGASRASSRHQMVSFANVASRLRAAVRNSENMTSGSNEILDVTSHQFSRGMLDRRDGNFSTRLDSGSSTVGGMSSRFRFFSELGLAVLPTGGTNTGVLSSDCPTLPSRRTSTVKKSYYYKMKMFPKANKSFKVKLDRLSVSALFDRNRSVISCIFDVLMACLVAFLAGLVLATGIFFDIWLFMFSFTVAGAHFSLLKSVQPDASSPIHGFNWLVAYSRPVYFCIVAVIVLALHYFANDPRYDKIPWNWNPYRLYETSGEMILLAFRDLFATFLVLLPFAFTMGWLPQVNTLVHHLLEQLEMHIFGGTASLGVLSAVLQIIKSLLCWTLLGGLSALAFSVDSKTTQTPAFSAFLAVAVALSYLLSRFSSNPHLFSILCHAMIFPNHKSKSRLTKTNSSCISTSEDDNCVQETDELDVSDPLPGRLRSTVIVRARHDLLFSAFLLLVVFALHSTSLFSATQPYFTVVIVPICVLFGVLNHYFYQQLRTHNPWKLVAKPLLQSHEYSQYECPDEAKLMNFETIHVWMLAVEKNVLYPLLAVAIMTECGWSIPLARVLGPLIILRLLRGGFSHPQLIYMPLAIAFTITYFDWSAGPPFALIDLFKETSSTPLFSITLYILIVLYPKWLELYLKMNFVMAYVAPWQISWGSAFHAFAQPFSIPHSALIWTQTVLSSLLSAPLNPFLGSSFFTTSYVRPVKFWERDYNTKRSDASNTTLASQIDRGPMLDDSNLNAVFYEHLTRSLQKSLAGDLQMGRWSTSVQPGDCFILASAAALHFQVEAISDDQSQGTGCCCCAPGSLPGFLSLNTAWSLRWLAWEVVTGKYIIDGYSITDNSAVNLLQVHELRRLLVTLYVKCIVYYTLSSSKLRNWISNETIRSTLEHVVANTRYVDVDHLFCSTNDEDFDMNEMGISRSSFSECYSIWISHCMKKRIEKDCEEINSEHVISLCFVLSLLGRRALGAASYNRHSNAAESFLYGLHALFKGDFRITCQRDEWVFADMDLLRCVIAPAVKMALKLHQDHFAAPDDFEDPDSLFNLIADYQTKLFISHEHDPAWRRAIIANTPSLLALRHMYDEGQDDYKIIMLNRMHLNMRVIKLNRECVRAFWAGQQQELIFLRNRNPERGSIQNARQVLRNMINSSADQPVGYPIYVSPLTTSFAETHSQMASIIGPPITVERIFSAVRRACSALCAHFGPSGSSSLGVQSGCGAAVTPVAPQQMLAMQPPQKSALLSEIEERASASSGHMENSIVHMTPEGNARVTLARKIPGNDDASSDISKILLTDTTMQADAKKIGTERHADGKENMEEDLELNCAGLWVRINDVEQVFRYLNEPLKSTGEPLVLWPSEDIRQISGRNSWYCQPSEGLIGRVVFTWYPNHPDRKFRSHIGDAIYLVASPEMAFALVPVSEKGCTILSPEMVLDPQCGVNKKEFLRFVKKIQNDLENL